MSRLHVGEMTQARFGFLTLGFPVASWYSFAVQAQQDLGIRPVWWGLLLTISSIASIVAMRRFVHLPDRATRPLAAGAALTLPGAGAALVLSPHVLATTVLLVVFGVSLGLVQIDVNKRASELEDVSGRPVLASCHGFFSIGVMAAGAVSYLTAGSDRQRLWVAVSIAVLAAAGWVVRRSRAVPVMAGSDTEPVAATAVPAVPLVVLVSVAVVLRLMEGAINTWHSALVDREMGLVGFGGAAYAAYGLGGVCVRFLADRARSRFGILSTTAVVGPLAVSAFALSLAGDAAASIATAMFLMGAALGIGYPDVLKLAASGPSKGGTGHLLSLALTGGTVGSLAANPLVGLSTEFVSVRTTFLVLDAALAVAFLYTTVRYVMRRRRQVAVPG